MQTLEVFLNPLQSLLPQMDLRGRPFFDSAILDFKDYSFWPMVFMIRILLLEVTMDLETR